MKINKKTNERVNNAVAECRKALVESTIDLMKQIGAESGQDVLFTKTLFLFQHKGNTTETIVADRIAWCDGRGERSFYLLEMDGEMHRSDMMLSLSSLMAIYKEVSKIVKEH